VNESSRVLVVDDEPNIVDVISMALRFQGFSVESAGTGADALAAVASFRPDLIILDVMLPDMEGFEVARRLGADRARVPIVFLTARDATEDKIRGLTMGADDYVTKPFSLEELVARVRPKAQLEVSTSLGAVVGTHAGPGTVGFFWFDDAE
jgi:two-component system OmpR family response regulator